MKYTVDFYYHTGCSIEVEAINIQEATEKAEQIICREEYTQKLTENLQLQEIEVKEN